jgi:hypothetical protein
MRLYWALLWVPATWGALIEGTSRRVLNHIKTLSES